MKNPLHLMPEQNNFRELKDYGGKTEVTATAISSSELRFFIKEKYNAS